MLRNRSFVRLIAFLLTLTSTILFSIAAPARSQSRPINQPAREIRGVWLTNIDSEAMFSPSNIERSIQQLARLNFNTVYPTVWNWGYTLYHSQVAEQAIGYRVDPTVPALKDFDALSEIVKQGHRKGLTVIPWFEFGFMTTAHSELAELHPDWLTQQRNGSQIWLEGVHERKWLNPFKPEVQQFIQNLILEIVTRYDVDGIQFDDHFGLPAEFGYDNFTVQLYKEEHRGQSPPQNPQNADWVRWRADKITRFMTQLYQAVKARKSSALVSLAPNTYSFAYNRSLQDWRTWEQRGLLEELILQVYRDSIQGFIAELSLPEIQAARQHIPTGIGILTGLRDHPVKIEQVARQVQAVRARQFSGISFFFYESLWHLCEEQVSSRQAALHTLFPSPVQRPKTVD